MTENDNLKMGVEWGYNKVLLNIYSTLITDFQQLNLANKQLGNLTVASKRLSASLSSFYMSVQAGFNKYLEKKDRQDYPEIDKDKYLRLSYSNRYTYEDLCKMVSLICLWTQKEGMFKTYTENVPASQAFRKSGKWH